MCDVCVFLCVLVVCVLKKKYPVLFSPFSTHNRVRCLYI